MLDANRRLAEIRYSFEAKAKKVHALAEVLVPTFAGAGPSSEKTYAHREIFGEGESPDEAVSDWHSKLPEGSFDALVWRKEPELVSERDFRTGKTRWGVLSRLAVVPLGDLN